MAKKNRAQVFLEYAAVRTILGGLTLLPRSAAVSAGIFVARIAHRFLPRLRRIGMINLQIAFPEKTVDEHEKLLRGTFDNLGRVLGDLSQFSRSTPESLARLIEFRIDPETLAEYERIKAEGRGVIIISPHLGNWELLVYAWSALREPISYLARPLDNPKIEDLTVRLRTKFGNRPINKTNAVSMAIKILRNGGILGILADVNAHPKEGVFVPFFGMPACTSSGVAMLAKRTNAAIIPMCGVWDAAAGKYIAVHGKIIEPANTNDRHADIVTTTAEFTAEVEKLIRAFPDQWLWIHKRWKSRPPGEPGLY